ncbi:MAG: beta-galactosidase [bacterium]|nr:beta-galactosidase [bacterium]
MQADNTFTFGVIFAPRTGEAVSLKTPCPVKVEEARRYFDNLFFDLAAHNINTAVEFCGYPEHYEIILEAAERYGIRVVLSVKQLAEIIRQPLLKREEAEASLAQAIGKLDTPSLLGYYLIDEPREDIIENQARVDSILKELDPSRVRLSCLDNVDIMERIFSIYQPEILLIDVYPLTRCSPAGDLNRGHGERQDYSFTQYIDKAHSLKPNNPLWVILQAFGHGDIGKFQLWRMPSPSEIRVMTYLAISHGAKGIIYFLYNTLDNMPHEYLRGMRDEEGEATPILSEIGRIGEEIKILSPFLMELKPVESLIDDISEPLDIRSFVDNRGNKVLIVVNKNISETAALRLNIAEDRIGNRIESIVDAYNGDELPFSKHNGTIHIDMALPPARCRCLKFISLNKAIRM